MLTTTPDHATNHRSRSHWARRQQDPQYLETQQLYFQCFYDLRYHSLYSILKEPLASNSPVSSASVTPSGYSPLTATAGGMLGGTAEKVGGPFSSQGAVGSQFTEGGSIGGTMQEQLGKGQNTTFNK